MQNITTSAREVYPRPLEGESHDEWATRTECFDVEPSVWQEIQDALQWAIDAEQCEGHETTRGPIGSVFYCDGSCRR